jgi:hypothetical protein
MNNREVTMSDPTNLDALDEAIKAAATAPP